jgi:rare lipoprotein A
MALFALLFFVASAAEGQEQACSSLPSGPCVAKVSWYGREFHDRRMADGRKFNMYDPRTVAHKRLPFGTRLGLTNPETGRSIEVVVRDRGPYVKGRQFDLSYAAAEQLGFAREGHANLKVDYVVVPAPKRKNRG